MNNATTSDFILFQDKTITITERVIAVERKFTVPLDALVEVQTHDRMNHKAQACFLIGAILLIWAATRFSSSATIWAYFVASLATLFGMYYQIQLCELRLKTVTGDTFSFTGEKSYIVGIRKLLADTIAAQRRVVDAASSLV